jgi:8-oxo-dGTP pyrophosphatase MutT (NUDIX family)
MEKAFLTRLKEQLQMPLPGLNAQWEMAHVKRDKVRPEDLQPSQFRSSAVMVLLIERVDGFVIPLTERHTYKGAHSGQVSFPGGKFDEGDVTLLNTALRECKEEIGLQDGIEILGELSSIYIPVSQFVVQPFIGVLRTPEPVYDINSSEVKSIIELQLKDLLLPELVKETFVEPSPGLKLKTPYFDVQGKIVWGATAMILNELKHLLLKI